MNCKEALEALPKTTEEVAEFLRKKGYRGRRHVIDACPVAKYLQDILQDKYAYAGKDNCCGGYIDPKFIDGELDLPVENYPPTPSHIKLFIINFDSGKYPDLIEEKEE